MKTPDEAMDLIESMDASDIAILRDRAHIPTKKSLLELTSQDTLLVTGCTICGGAHESGYCIPNEEQFAYEVNYMGNQPRGNFNTSGFPGLQNNQQYQQQRQWQNHPGNQFNRDQGGSSTRPQQQMPSLYNRNLAQFMQVSMSNQKRIESVIKNLEVQVVQLAKQLAKRPSNSFRANTEKNPKEECKAVMTRSKMVIQAEESRADKKVEGFKQQLADELALEPVVEFEKKEGKSEANIEKKKEATSIECKEEPYPLVPSRKDKERHLARFLDIFKKLEITLPFGEALQQMLLYAKILKDLLTKKNRYIHSDKIVVEGYCSVVIQCILPPKHKDRGVVTIPCFIAEVVVGKALIDLGASINLMPLSMCRRLGEIKIMPTRMTLQLANCSITPPYGVIEDVLVKVKHLIFPPDLVVIDIEEDADIPLILGCPFMSIASCMVDVGKKILQMGIEDQL
ncbi:uncharacterized protein LOC114375499 [Glycine soja]|uniref:uncharacterized protein LOC114375499 n=1 Tax=Glycine soja TaxID=3848 RepID=UPI00103CFCC9|nr:uncharacterized protein LOC114375499 [Glycine soja]